MNNNDIENSLFLIGPSCVGKSLLATELGKKLNLPVISIDDLLTFVMYENNGMIGRSNSKKRKFINICTTELSDDKQISQNLQDPKLSAKQINRFYEVMNIYTYYDELLGNLTPFRQIVAEFDKAQHKVNNDMEYVCCYSVFSTLIMEKIIKTYNKPLIFDTPAMFGWKWDENKISNKYKKTLMRSPLNIQLAQIEQFQHKTLKTGKTILLEPGADYQKRNMSKIYSWNDLLLNNLNNYIDYANISITTNNLFNQPDNKYFMQRSWFDVKEIEAKEKLKNKCNIANICDEILAMLDELASASNLNLNT